MGFSSILDIGSFFIGMIINLIFVALMCYYFKRKYDYLYEAQCEQSKIIYQLIHKPMSTPTPTPSLDYSSDPLVQRTKGTETDRHSQTSMNSQLDTDDDSCSEDEMEEYVSESKTVELTELPIMELKLEKLDLNTESLDMETLDMETLDREPPDREPVSNVASVEELPVEEPFEMTLQSDQHYNKMSMKQLKEILSSKGIKPKNNIRKEELVELLTKDQEVSA